MSQEKDLSRIGKAAYKELKTNHEQYRNKLWNVTSGKIVGDIHHTPKDCWSLDDDPSEGHSDWFVDKVCEIMSRTKVWCDFMSLDIPDGIFMEKIKGALATIAVTAKNQEKKIIIRFMFGHVVKPLDCDALLQELTKDIDVDSNIELWVGAWRKLACWNHAKIIAVDGQFLHTGGHNLWDNVYLRKDPIHDVSVELEGNVAVDAHLFANEQWKFIQDKQSTLWGRFKSKLPDSWWGPYRVRVTVSEFPEGPAATFPPSFETGILPEQEPLSTADVVPIISLGRYGNIFDDARSSDDAFIAVFDAAESSIRMALQDLGPVNKTVGGKKIVYKDWPKRYMSALGRAVWTKGVDVELVLSNPGSGEERGNYSNGWSCDQVAAEITKTIQEQFPEASDEDCRQKVTENLRICFLKTKQGSVWKSGNKQGLHSKFFIVDDVSTYIGSQNLYLFDLAEWGVLIDDEQKTAQIMEELWAPMWKFSYTGEDCDVKAVMDGLKIDRNPTISRLKRADMEQVAALECNRDLADLGESKFYK